VSGLKKQGEINLEYAAGLDGGGTKTAVTVCDLDGNLLEKFTDGPINLNGDSSDHVANSFHQIFNRLDAIYGLDLCKSICLGAAGISNPEVKQASLLLTGDHKTALYGALGKQDGIILISGTGSICYGRNSRGEEHRSGGFGYLIDDEGSGYAIGRDIISAVVRAYDGRSQQTVMTDLLYSKLGVSDIQDVIHFVYEETTNKRDIASLSIIMDEACGQGDLEALKIAKRCGTELLSLVIPVIEKLNLQNDKLALAGSILQKDRYVRNAFTDQLKPAYHGIECVMPLQDASFGACQMALDLLKEKQ
jgi:N-acetylglucosamine kinase-like BadF-type ATPase